MKYRSNVIYSWESGRTAPTAARTLWAASRVGIDLREAFERFHAANGIWYDRAAFEKALALRFEIERRE